MENNEQTSPEETNPLENHSEPAEAVYATGQAVVTPLVITEDIRSYLYEMAKWTKFLSIVGFIFTAFIVTCAFGIGAFMTLMSRFAPANTMTGVGTGGLTVVYLLIALVYFYPSLLMFKYSNTAKKAVLFGDQLSLSAAFSNLKSLFKFWGIITIVIIAFYVIVIIFILIAGAALTNMGRMH